MRQYWVTYWFNYLVFLLIHIMLLGFHGVLAEMCPEFGRIRGFKHEGLEHGKVSKSKIMIFFPLIFVNQHLTCNILVQKVF